MLTTPICQGKRPPNLVLRSREPFPSLRSKTDPLIPPSIFPLTWEFCVLQPKEQYLLQQPKFLLHFSKSVFL